MPNIPTPAVDVQPGIPGNPRESQECPGVPGTRREAPGIAGKPREAPGIAGKPRESPTRGVPGIADEDMVQIGRRNTDDHGD